MNILRWNESDSKSRLKSCRAIVHDFGPYKNGCRAIKVVHDLDFDLTEFSNI